MCIIILSRPFILGVAVQKPIEMGTGYSTYGRHFITVKGEVIAQCCQSTVEEPTLKIKGKIILKPNSISAVAVRTPRITDTEVDILHRVDHKIPRELNIHILNTGNNSISLGKKHTYREPKKISKSRKHF